MYPLEQFALCALTSFFPEPFLWHDYELLKLKQTNQYTTTVLEIIYYTELFYITVNNKYDSTRRGF